MNICVCIKQVPDTNEIKVDPVTHTLVRKGVPSVVNSFDTYAQEVGVRLKEKLFCPLNVTLGNLYFLRSWRDHRLGHIFL